MNLKNMDKKLIKKLGTILIIIMVLLIIMFIFMIINGRKIKYTDIESKLIVAAKKYYQAHPEELPQAENGYVTINSDKLIEEKYIKDLSKYAKDTNAVCSGQVRVSKNNDQLLYSAMLSCGDYYETKKLKNVIASSENIVTSGNGLYLYNNRYIFRGDNVNNYAKFADRLWLILGINSDGTIRMIDTTETKEIVWDDRYNSDEQYNAGINDFNVSRIKDTLNNEYDSFTDSDKAYLTVQNLCIGKRSVNDTNNDGSIECSKTLENQYIGLIQANEYPIASLDDSCISPSNPECTNYNFLTKIYSTWTLTAKSESSYEVYLLSGRIVSTEASDYNEYHSVVNINSDVNYVSGDGTENNPYVFK